LRRLYIIAGAMLLALVSLAGCGNTDTSATGQTYLLVLGDSLSTGFQPAGAGDPLCTHRKIDSTGNGGWACVLLSRLRNQDASYAVSNLAVNSEDTCGFITGRTCDGKTIGGPVPQLRQARDFLRSHMGSTGLITLDIGADDATSLEDAARKGNNALVLTQLPTVFDRAAANYRRILRRLRQIAPNVPIMALGYYVPNLPDFIPQDIRPVAQSAIKNLTQQFNAKIVAAAREVNATYVDLYTPFRSKQAELLVSGDIHPNDAGQRLIARLIWRAYQKR
jgi:lysophospholipase L1-like esterase